MLPFRGAYSPPCTSLISLMTEGAVASLPVRGSPCTSSRGSHPNHFLSRDSGVPKSLKLGLPQLWSPITLRADLGLRCGLKQSCSYCQELSNDMSHTIYKQVNRVDSRPLFSGRKSTSSLTIGLSFGHNLCFKCPNEQCEPILNIYVLGAFQWYKEHHKPLSFDS